jgi:hypothetical protein
MAMHLLSSKEESVMVIDRHPEGHASIAMHSTSTSPCPFLSLVVPILLVGSQQIRMGTGVIGHVVQFVVSVLGAHNTTRAAEVSM